MNFYELRQRIEILTEDLMLEQERRAAAEDRLAEIQDLIDRLKHAAAQEAVVWLRVRDEVLAYQPGGGR